MAGDIAFAPPENTALLFARGNLITLMRNAGQELVPISEIAGQFDTYLISRPDTEGAEVVPAIRRFQSPAEEIRVGANAPLEAEAVDPLERPVWYKFFTDQGEVLLQERSLYYRPGTVGPQTITLFALNANRGAVRQELQLTAN